MDAYQEFLLRQLVDIIHEFKTCFAAGDKEHYDRAKEALRLAADLKASMDA